VHSELTSRLALSARCVGALTAALNWYRAKHPGSALWPDTALASHAAEPHSVPCAGHVVQPGHGPAGGTDDAVGRLCCPRLLAVREAGWCGPLDTSRRPAAVEPPATALPWRATGWWCRGQPGRCTTSTIKVVACQVQRQSARLCVSGMNLLTAACCPASSATMSVTECVQ
jgi:hypothetical protein